MISLEQIKKTFPSYLQENKKFEEYMLKEYLQYIMLDIIFKSKWKNELSFIGGTNLRILYDFQRFSEDLDFDNFQMNESEFDQLAEHLEISLQNLGYKVNRKKTDGDKRIAFGYGFYFPELKYNLSISGHKEARFLIKMYSQSNTFKYNPEKKYVQNFNLFFTINSTPIDVLLSMKIGALIQRSKGCDFWDCIHLMGKTSPNWEYLEKRLEIKNEQELKTKLLHSAESVDLSYKKNDFDRLVFNPADADIILEFVEYIRQKTI